MIRKKIPIFFEIMYIIILLVIIVKGILYFSTFDDNIEVVAQNGYVLQLSNGEKLNMSLEMKKERQIGKVKFQINQLSQTKDGSLKIIFTINDASLLKNGITLTFFDENNKFIDDLFMDLSNYHKEGVAGRVLISPKNVHKFGDVDVNKVINAFKYEFSIE